MRFVLALGVALLTGCAASGVPYSDVSSQLAPPTDQQARVVFLRTRDTLLYLARRATITVDGEKVGTTGYGGFHVHDLPAGAYKIRADMWDAPGHCELILNAERGHVYYFQVDPRSESFGAFGASGFAASLLAGGVLSEIAFVTGGLAGNAIESYGQICGGAFRLYPVDAQTATSRLTDLRLSQ